MRIAMMGSGGVGGLIGARLAQAGADVSFIARGAHLAAMRSQGLTLKSPVGDIHLPKAQVTDDPGSLKPVELVIFSVKLWDTEAAARQMLPLIGPDTGVLSLQNGVKKDDIQVTIDGAQVTLAAEVKREKEASDEERVLHTERVYGKVSRSFTLPQEVDESKAEAKFRDGVLELKLPKKAAAARKQISIQ